MALNQEDYPISVLFDFQTGEFSPYQQVARRHTSDLGMMFQDQSAVKAMKETGDPLVYEIFYYGFKTSKSDMALGVTRIQPGLVGDEYFMTKGHYHEADDEPEIYFCVMGEGYLLMEEKGGEFAAEKWQPGTITHIPPMWAHRVVNTGETPLVFVASYHLAAGHDYEPIIAGGFLKRLVAKDGNAIFIDNDQRK
jgi:glucose-6-phosphate isomerase, archaeal